MKNKWLRRKRTLLAGWLLLVLLVTSCTFAHSVPPMTQLQSQGKSIPALVFQPGRQRLALVAGADYGVGNQWIELWDLANRKLEKTHPLEQGGVTSLAFSPDGLVLATANSNGGINLYDSEHLILQATLALTLTPSLQSLSFSPDSKQLAARGERAIWLWEIATQRLVQTFSFPPANHYSNPQLTFSNDGQLLATQDDNAITLWRVSDGNAAAVIPFGDPGLCSVAFVPQRQAVASCQHNGDIALIDSATNTPLQQIDNGPDATLGLAFTPDGQLFAALGVHGNGGRGTSELPVTTLGLYSVANGRAIEKFDVVTGAQYEQVTISPNGEWLAIFSANEGDVRLLSLRTYVRPH